MCPLFLHLPKLARLANQIGDRPGECDAAVKDQICQGCTLKESAGDYCPDYTARTCPLSRYSTAVISRLQRMMPFAPDSVAGEPTARLAQNEICPAAAEGKNAGRSAGT